MNNKIIKAKYNESVFDEFEGLVGSNTMYFIVNMKDIDIDTFKESIKRTARDIPIMACRMVRGFWKDKWTPIEDYDVNQIIETIKVDSKDSFYERAYEQFLQLPSRRINMRTEPPFKAKIFYNEEISNKVLILCMHHSFTDGRGTARVFELIEKHYFAILQNKPLPKQKNVSTVSALILSLNAKSFFDMFATSFKGAMQQSKFNTAIKPLLPADVVYDTNSCEAIERIVLYKADIDKLKDHYKDYNITVNSILMLLTLKLMVNYNKDLLEPSTHACVAFGTDLRRYFKKNPLSIANYSVMDSVTVRSEDVDNLPVMAAEFDTLKNKPIGLKVIVEPVMTSLLPISTQRKILRKWAFKYFVEGSIRSIQTTNIGRTDEYAALFGDTVENISFIGCSPICGFPQVSVARYKDTMTLYFLKYNDTIGIAKKVRDDFNELLNEIITK